MKTSEKEFIPRSGMRSDKNFQELSLQERKLGPLRESERDRVIASGGSLGILSVTSRDSQLCVQVGDRGRGLFASKDIKSGTVVATFEFTLSTDLEAMERNQDLLSPYSVSWSKNCLARLHKPTTEHLANLINTSAAQGVPNNCKISVQRSRHTISIKTMHAVRAGEELLASYGHKFSGELAHQTTVEVEDLYDEDVEILEWARRGSWWVCPNCSRSFQTLRKAGAHEISCFKDNKA